MRRGAIHANEIFAAKESDGFEAGCGDAGAAVERTRNKHSYVILFFEQSHNAGTSLSLQTFGVNRQNACHTALRAQNRIWLVREPGITVRP